MVIARPAGVDPEKYHLVSPYDPDPRKWLDQEWIDQYTGKRFRITTRGYCGSTHTARVKTYGDVVAEYEFHPESKCADSHGEPCDQKTVGLLQRRHIKIDELKYIGKESNSLEEVASGLVHSERNVYTEYVDRRREWVTKLLPAMRKIKLKLLVEACKGRISRRALIDMRAGRSMPYRKNQEFLAPIIRKLAQAPSVRLRMR